MPTVTIYLSEENMAHLRTLQGTGVNVSAVCSKAIAAEAKQVASEHKFAVGDEIILSMNGYYNGKWGRVVGYAILDYIQVMLTDRTLALFKASEMMHRERTIA